MKAPAVTTTICQKNVNSVKITLYIMGPKSQLDARFSNFTKKKCSHAHVLSKNVHSLKTNCSRAHVLSCKRLSFQNTVL